MSSDDLRERIFRLNDTAFPWDESGQDFVAEIVGCIDEQAERIKELELWEHNSGSLYIRRDAHDECVKKLDAKIAELEARIKRNDDRVSRLLASYESGLES